MNDLKVFQNSEFGELGVLMLDGKEHFPATKCAKVLGYSNPQEAIRTHCKGVRETLTPSAGGSQKVNYILEGDLYRLIIRSKLPGAERFERWIFDEVIPEIRRNGAYIGSDIRGAIQQAVASAMGEAIKQLLPIIKTMANIASDSTKALVPTEDARPRKRLSIISRLPADIQNEVADMIYSGNYSYVQIQRHLKEYGVSISPSALCRYRQYLDKQ